MIEFNRYLVQQHYSGKFDDVQTLCACQDIQTANMISDLLHEKYKDRVAFEFKVKKIADDYIDFLDDVNFVGGLF